MTTYNRVPEKKEYKEPFRESKREPIRTEQKGVILEDPDFHEEIMFNIKQLDGKQGQYDILLRNLRLAQASGDLSRDHFNYYKTLADKSMRQKQQASERKAQKEAQKSESLNISSSYVPEAKREREKDEFDERRVRGERIEQEEVKPEPESKWAQLKRAFEFVKSPLGRVSLFIVLGLFLIFYLTKGGMSDVIESPLIIILAVLFIILILGRGGKTRTVESNSWF